MKLHELSAPTGAKHSAKRVGRGIGSGHGKTSCRGHKGQKARGSIRPGFEGGQTPLYMRLRKHGGRGKGAMPIRMFQHEYAIINVGALQQIADRMGAGTVVTPQLLTDSRLVRVLGDGVRVLGGGELTASVTVYAHHFTASAKEKIEKAGGSAIVLAKHAFAPPADEATASDIKGES